MWQVFIVNVAKDTKKRAAKNSLTDFYETQGMKTTTTIKFKLNFMSSTYGETRLLLLPLMMLKKMLKT